MRLFKKLFGSVEPSNDADRLNAVFVPLRDAICDFKDQTKISWLIILPEVLDVSAIIFRRTRGIDGTLQYFKERLIQLDRRQSVPHTAILSVGSPDVPPSEKNLVGGLLVKLAEDLLNRFPQELVAQAFFEFAAMAAERASDGMLAAGLIKRTYEEIEADKLRKTSAPAEPENPFAAIARVYDKDDVDLRCQLMAGIYKTIYGSRERPDELAYHASFVCGVSVTIRETIGVDIASLVFLVERPPLANSHPLMMTIPAIDLTIAELLKLLSSVAAEDRRRRLDAHAMMNASLIWKSYLLALNTYPDEWGTDAICALASLRMLTTAGAAYVRASLSDDTHGATHGNFPEGIRSAVTDADWPPRGYLDLYFKNREIIERKCRKEFGTFF